MTAQAEREAPRVDAGSRLRSVLDVALPLLVAFFVGGLVIRVTGDDPLAVYALLAREAFGGPDRIAATLAAATPLLFTGLATAVAFRAGLFTLGAEGSFIAGGLAAAVIGAQVHGWPAPVAVAAALVGATATGWLVGVVPAYLRARWRVEEVVTTLMVNFIVQGVAAWLVQAFFQERGQANSATAFVAPAAELPSLLPPSQVNAGLVIGLALIVGYGLWSSRTSLGYEFRMVGTNPRFATAVGVNVSRVAFLAIVASGAIAGAGGGVHTLGVVHRFVGGFSPGYGFTGLAIALLARFHPVGIVAAALLFFAPLASAGSTAQLFADIPLQIVDVLQGTVMAVVVARFALPRLRGRLKRGADT